MHLEKFPISPPLVREKQVAAGLLVPLDRRDLGFFEVPLFYCSGEAKGQLRRIILNKKGEKNLIMQASLGVHGYMGKHHDWRSCQRYNQYDRSH